MSVVFKKILIIRLSAIGDVVRALPALRALRHRFPSAYIAWIVEDSAQDILEGHPEVDHLFVFKRKRWSKGFFSVHNFLRSSRETIDFLKEVREKRFDLVLDFHGIFKSGLLSFLSGAPMRVGFSRRYSKEFNYLFNNYHIELERDAMSRIERNLNFIRFLDIHDDRQEPIIPITIEDREYIDNFFKEKGIGEYTPLIVIHPGTSEKTSYKRWSVSYYAAVADKLIERLGAKIVWTWGPGELDCVEKVVEKMKHESIIACKTERLRQLAEIFRRCDLFLGSDSGPMHIASFVNTPVAVIYGPTDPVVNAPYEKNPHVVLRKDLPCNPCRKRNCQSIECMDMVKPDEVFDAVCKLLKTRSDRGV